MDFFRSLRETLTPLWLVVGGLLIAWGYLTDAKDLYDLGLDAWVWQIVGVIVIVAYLMIFVHKNRIDRGTVEAANALISNQEPPKAKSEVPRLRILLAEVRTVARDAEFALTGRDEKRMRDFMPELEAAYLTLAKLGFPTPNFDDAGPDRRKIDASLRYLKDITPFIRLGHIAEGADRAAKLVPMLEAYVADGIKKAE